jgi:hypothetical protein
VSASSTAWHDGQVEHRILSIGQFLKRLFYDHRSLCYVAIASAFGLVIGLFFKLASRGILTGVAPVVAVMCAIVWLTGIVLIDLIWPTKSRTYGGRLITGIAQSATSLVIIAAIWLLAVMFLPDPARVYLLARWQYIQTHWLTDPVSKLSYFPLDHTRVNNYGAFPRNFYLLDRNGNFEVDRYSDRLISPSCPHAKYEAKLLSGNIYMVRFFVDDTDEPAVPCLVTPTPQEG